MSAEEWAKAFVTAQAAFPDVGKGKQAEIPTKSGGSYKYSYADLPSIIDKLKDVLSGVGLGVAQSVTGDRQSIAVETRIYHVSGHVEVFGPLVLDSGADARSAGSAITYARRYALCAALGIAPDEDDDGAQASRPREEPRELTPWEWAWNESKVFKAWTDDERLKAAKIAMENLALGEPANMDEAKSILEHMRGQYESKTDALPLEEA